MPRRLVRIGRRCRGVCRIIRSFPFHPSIPGHKKLVRHWPYVIGSMALFSVGVYIVGHGFVAGLVAARIVEATGDLLLDRGVVPEL